MQIFFFSAVETLIIDVIVWICFHLGIGFWASQIPVEKFDPDHWFFQTFDWEKGGQIYQDLFRVRSWKRFIPQGSKLYPNTFSLQKLKSLDPEYLELWLRESIRAEFCHWMMILPGFLFFLWNSVEVGWLMVLYAVANNFFPIVAQRYNRPRIRRYLELARRDQHRQPVIFEQQAAAVQ
ncbi:MAG: glycosyl-4,4'-diaponeurosporenoate acyltransferase [Chloroflexi bacterium]|jgi:glycosyl-4,4'-diaponeurosporenoate acyltransferase|nr:glycosyl-4,4'-diaponeurosporenoate acyltransferase [Chloroflexota bacterium]